VLGLAVGQVPQQLKQLLVDARALAQVPVAPFEGLRRCLAGLSRVEAFGSALDAAGAAWPLAGALPGEGAGLVGWHARERGSSAGAAGERTFVFCLRHALHAAGVRFFLDDDDDDDDARGAGAAVAGPCWAGAGSTRRSGRPFAWEDRSGIWLASRRVLASCSRGSSRVVEAPETTHPVLVWLRLMSGRVNRIHY
jgi:hypothetical protein